MRGWRVVTAYPHQYRRIDVLSAGCAIFIVKPIDTRELVQQLQAVAMTGRLP
jgi:DNA-binding NarL/FixJ family response regulator